MGESRQQLALSGAARDDSVDLHQKPLLTVPYAVAYDRLPKPPISTAIAYGGPRLLSRGWSGRVTARREAGKISRISPTSTWPAARQDATGGDKESFLQLVIPKHTQCCPVAGAHGGGATLHSHCFRPTHDSTSHVNVARFATDQAVPPMAASSLPSVFVMLSCPKMTSFVLVSMCDGRDGKVDDVEVAAQMTAC